MFIKRTLFKNTFVVRLIFGGIYHFSDRHPFNV